MSTDIVVTARRIYNTAGIVVTNFNYTQNTDGSPETAYDSAANTDPNAVEVQVNVSVTDPANQAKAQEAAQNVANAVAQIIDAAQKLPANTPITLPGGGQTTIGQLLTDIKATKFVVTDTRNFNNGGVGGADRTTMTDTLYFGAFASGTGVPSYTDSQWNGQGVIGTILHEMGHMSSGGYGNFRSELTHWSREMAARKIPHAPSDFYTGLGTDYALDNESYAQGFALSAASVLSLSIASYDANLTQAGQVTNFQGAASIYQQHRMDFDF